MKWPRDYFNQRVSPCHVYGTNLLMALAISMGCFLFGHRVYAGAVSCENANVVVDSQIRQDAATACEGAADAIHFFRSFGISTKAEIEVRIVSQLPAETTNQSIAGYYSPKKGCVYMLSFAALEKVGTPFDMPVDRTLYRSMITHEAAHAIAAHNFVVAKPQIKAKEYIAYVTMFTMMPQTYRQRIFDKFPADAFDSEWDINDIRYLFDPIRFGVSAYKHFLRPKNGPVFIRRVLEGRALQTKLFY